ncbi:MAG: hypothetical protein KDK76_07320, partial [Chlamydiia bacterium]|nr:hypothetical protein [Chlamydiia bacterium]
FPFANIPTFNLLCIAPIHLNRCCFEEIKSGALALAKLQLLKLFRYREALFFTNCCRDKGVSFSLIVAYQFAAYFRYYWNIPSIRGEDLRVIICTLRKEDEYFKGRDEFKPVIDAFCAERRRLQDNAILAASYLMNAGCSQA